MEKDSLGKDIARRIDHTLLRPSATRADVERLCAEALEWGFAAVCVNPTWVDLAVRCLRQSSVKVCTVVGFPLGATFTEVKAMEARLALERGALEIDMVMNIGALKGGDEATALDDIRAVVDQCATRGACCKVILETALLTDEEKRRACQLAVRAGAHYVKTSTGFSSGGATVRDVRLLADEVRSSGLGVKASGGIRTYQEALSMIEAGATRIGTSCGVAIVRQAMGESGT